MTCWQAASSRCAEASCPSSAAGAPARLAPPSLPPPCSLVDIEALLPAARAVTACCLPLPPSPPRCSQKDIADGLPLERALSREKAFFERHPAYRAYAGRCGTPYLARMLSHLLMAAVKAWLPQASGGAGDGGQGGHV